MINNICLFCYLTITEGYWRSLKSFYLSFTCIGYGDKPCCFINCMYYSKGYSPQKGRRCSSGLCSGGASGAASICPKHPCLIKLSGRCSPVSFVSSEDSCFRFWDFVAWTLSLPGDPWREWLYGPRQSQQTCRLLDDLAVLPAPPYHWCSVFSLIFTKNMIQSSNHCKSPHVSMLQFGDAHSATLHVWTCLSLFS